MSEPTEPSPPKAPALARPLLAMAATALAVPALVPVIVLIEPRLVPFIAPMQATTGTVIFMVAISAVLLAMNWGFLYLLVRYLRAYGGR